MWETLNLKKLFQPLNFRYQISWLEAIGTTPLIYVASNFTAPQSGCTATIVNTGTNITFVGNSITLNPGFEVQLGGTFSALTQ